MTKKIISNKKGDGFFLPILAVCILIVVAALSISLTIKFNKTTNLGEHELAIISTMNEGEKIQLYIEESARTAAQKAYDDTNMNGGITPDLCKEDYLGYPLIDADISCAENPTYFEKQFKKQFTKSLSQHEQIKNYYAYDLKIDSSKTDTKITGSAVTNLIIPITDYSKYANTEIVNTLTSTQTGLTPGVDGTNYVTTLQQNNIAISSTNNCYENQNGCTYLGNVKPQVIEELVKMKQELLTCQMVITGAGEIGHSVNGAHPKGLGIDLRDDECVKNFLIDQTNRENYNIIKICVVDSMYNDEFKQAGICNEGDGPKHYHLEFKVTS